MYSEWAEDEIHIDRLEVFAHHGVYPEETRNGQIFYVNAVLYTDMDRACISDELEDTVDYGDRTGMEGYAILLPDGCRITHVSFWRPQRAGCRKRCC